MVYWPPIFDLLCEYQSMSLLSKMVAESQALPAVGHGLTTVSLIATESTFGLTKQSIKHFLILIPDQRLLDR
jgi:hypothetical protein